MGRNRKGGFNKRILKRDFKQPRSDTWQPARNNNSGPKRDGYPANELQNELFEEYYREQGIVPAEEWDTFMETLRRPLPTTFRINGSGRFADDLRDKLERDFFSHFVSESATVEGGGLQAPRALEWYPDKLAWQFDFSRAQLRKLPILEQIHELLKRENEAGAITRQEAVSMVPPLFLDVRPHHRILDTCAAPGSKTAQILEMLHTGTRMPTGFVIANDAEAQRCNLLTHQTKRMCSPCLLVTNHDATQYPLVAPSSYPKGEGVHFDRILCDVPCSGDGTIRKAPDIWRRWSFGNGNGLHNLQIRIASHAAYLLKVGGRMIYSTCTFNPIENEAVVAELLRRSGGAIRLLDCSNYLPGLRRVSGLTSWKVRDKHRFYSTFQEAVEANSPKLAASMFPGSDIGGFNLHLCMRILPHHCDTGGFFISVLEKVAPLTFDPSLGPAPPQAQGAVAEQVGDDGGLAMEAEGEAAGAAPPAGSLEEGPAEVYPPEPAISVPLPASNGVPVPVGEAGGLGGLEAPGDQPGAGVPACLPVWGPRGGGARGREGGKWRGIDPVVPFTDSAILDSISGFYGLDQAFPLASQLVTRSQAEVNRPKRLYFVSSGVKELLQMDETEQLKVTATGLKVFERQESKEAGVSCSYRIAQEGLPLLLPHIHRQIVRPTVTEFLRLVQERSICLPDSMLSANQAGQQEAELEVPDGEEAPEAPEVDGAEEAVGEGGREVKMEEGGEVPPGGDNASAGSGSVEGPEGASKRVKLGDGNAGPPRIPWADPDTLAQLAGISSGCCVCTLREEEAKELGLQEYETLGEGALTVNAPLAVCCWRGRASISILMSKGERSQMCEKLTAALKREGTLPSGSFPPPGLLPPPGFSGEVAGEVAVKVEEHAMVKAEPEDQAELVGEEHAMEGQTEAHVVGAEA